MSLNDVIIGSIVVIDLGDPAIKMGWATSGLQVEMWVTIVQLFAWTEEVQYSSIQF